MSREIFLLAGEASGDLRGAELIQALQKLDPSLKFSGMGGPKMKAAGMEILADVSDLAVVGIIEVLKNYSFFKKTMDELLSEIQKRRPLVVIGVDYPGFNLRLLKKVNETLQQQTTPKIKLIQYISPQLWAWNERRKWQMAKYLDLVLCLFPFEPQVYRETNLKTVFVGHPIIKNEYRTDDSRKKNLVALFPGSREKEIRAHMPVFNQLEKMWHSRPRLCTSTDTAEGGCATLNIDPNSSPIEFRYAATNEKNKKLIQSFSPHAQFSSSEQLLASAYAGIMCSGTATLEAAMCGLPMCVVYRVAWPTYWMGRALIKVPFLGMPNVLAQRELVREYIQSDLTSEKLSQELKRLLENQKTREAIQNGYVEIRKQLGEGETAENAAREILKLI